LALKIKEAFLLARQMIKLTFGFAGTLQRMAEQAQSPCMHLMH